MWCVPTISDEFVDRMEDVLRLYARKLDPDEPVVHIYAEGKTEEDSKALEAELHTMVEEIMQTEQTTTSTPSRPAA